MITISEIRKRLDQEQLAPCSVDPIATGELENADGEIKEYQLFEGWDLVRANQCDLEWGNFNLSLLEFIENQSYSQSELEEIEGYIQLDDSHWEWLKKSCIWKSNEYKWFFLYVDNYPQSACVVYHPKSSAILEEKEIYYVEFLAAAPWNRKNPMCTQLYKRVGKLTLQHVQKYCSDTLNWNLGFSLHSLPKAESYYIHLGMTSFRDFDKKINESTTLRYFEMLEEPANLFVRES
ncbi:hypothetical protein [Vreelandella venusta]|uniref:hypothetical protein n=1 Tax=Vreelandella venusta TaxID=44935 RepID=UPI00200DC5F0|nr:hypothetical protein [Halomonas venusta]UQI41434.1 hypothetical protein M3L73_04030 [Halomonas venusta]